MDYHFTSSVRVSVLWAYLPNSMANGKSEGVRSPTLIARSQRPGGHYRGKELFTGMRRPLKGDTTRCSVFGV